LGNDYLDGGANDDLLLGGEGNDKLWGGSGNDEIQGNEGNDEVMGGSGEDRLFGQAGEINDHCLPRHRVYHHPHCLAVRHSQCHHRVYHTLSHLLEYRHHHHHSDSRYQFHLYLDFATICMAVVATINYTVVWVMIT
jgi:hypothetical protein